MNVLVDVDKQRRIISRKTVS